MGMNESDRLYIEQIGSAIAKMKQRRKELEEMGEVRNVNGFIDREVVLEKQRLTGRINKMETIYRNTLRELL